MFNRMKNFVKKKYYDEVQKDDDSKGFSFKKLLHYLIAKPFDLWRDLMIPISEEGIWRRNYASLAPIVGFFTCLLYTECKIIALQVFYIDFDLYDTYQ